MLEVAFELGAFLEDEVGEVHGEDGVEAVFGVGGVHGFELGDAGGDSDIVFDLGDAGLLGVGEVVVDVVGVSPVECFLVAVDADGEVGVASFDELAGGVAGAGEVFSEGGDVPAPELFEGVVDEVDLGLDALDGELVEDMAVLGFGSFG